MQRQFSNYSPQKCGDYGAFSPHVAICAKRVKVALRFNVEVFISSKPPKIYHNR